MVTTFKYICLLFFVGFTTALFAQRDTTLTREVEVTKAFKPTINSANKINEMPVIDDVEHKKPVFNYEIHSEPILNTFSVTQLKAATIDNSKKKNPGYGLVRVGVGNYNKPYAEFFFNNVNSKKSIFGIHAKHLSSFGKVTLDGGDKVDAPYSKNEAEVYYKHSLSSSVLSVDVDFKHDGFKYYGYPLNPIPDILLEENKNITYQGTKQAFTKGGLNINLKNLTAEMDDPAFNFNFKYHYFGTKTEQHEHFGEFDMNFQKPLDTGTLLAGAGVAFLQADNIINRVTDTIGKRTQTQLFVKPAWYYEGKNVNVTVGLNAWFVMDNDMDAIAKVAPNIRVNYMPVKDVFKLYAGIDGNYISNHYSKIAYENPFVDPRHDVKNSFEKIHFYGGIDGKFSKKTNFKISVDYSMIDDKPLYYLKEYYFATYTLLYGSQKIIENTFNVLYDDINLLKFNLEIFHASSERLNLLLSGNYYAYKLDNQTEAWNMPDWDATFSLDYKITEQLSVGADIYLIGGRKALIVFSTDVVSKGYSGYSQYGYVYDYGYGSGYDYYSYSFDYESKAPVQNSYNLDSVFDLNVNATYKITKKFSAFGQLNNFGFQEYQRWLGYNVQSFNVLLGVNYSF